MPSCVEGQRAQSDLVTINCKRTQDGTASEACRLGPLVSPDVPTFCFRNIPSFPRAAELVIALSRAETQHGWPVRLRIPAHRWSCAIFTHYVAASTGVPLLNPSRLTELTRHVAACVQLCFGNRALAHDRPARVDW